MSTPKLLIIGAHPDDAELHAGGLMSLYRKRGWPVKVISATNGESGHLTQHGPVIAARRAQELKDSCAVIGAEAEVWPFRDGYLTPSFELRHQIIQAIRQYQPSLLLTHRTIDYHPDHRALAIAVQDASFLVTVPAVLPEVPHLRQDPVVAFMADHFTRPAPFQPDVIIDVESELDQIVEMNHHHTSQVYEWIAYNRQLGEPPAAEDDKARKAWLRQTIIEPRWRAVANRVRPQMIERWGQKRSDAVHYAEAFEIGEHGSPLTDELRERLFTV